MTTQEYVERRQTLGVPDSIEPQVRAEARRLAFYEDCFLPDDDYSLPPVAIEPDVQLMPYLGMRNIRSKDGVMHARLENGDTMPKPKLPKNFVDNSSPVAWDILTGEKDSQ